MKMTTTPPASWTGNLFRRPPLGVYTVTGSPEDAVMRCLDLWVTIGVREHAHGMPQQFARRGWVGTEITVDASSTATKMPSLDLPDVMGAVSGAGTLLHLAYEATAPEGLRAVTDTVGEVVGFVGSAAREAAGGVVDTVVEATGTVGEVAGFVGSVAYEGATSVANKVGGLVSGFASKTWRKEHLPKPGKCRIVVAACSLPDQEKEAAQLWCFLSDDSPKRSLSSDDQIDEAFQWLERKLTEQNVLLDVPHYVNQKDLPADSALTADSLDAMRQAASAEPHS
ncbi:MAG: hypothetical protein KH140_07370 [Actinomyces sp.]|nr:hypothetical protein [Actinomyces sp.]